MAEVKMKAESEMTKEEKLDLKRFASQVMGAVGKNPWIAVKTDSMRGVSFNTQKEFQEALSACRFFYRRDPMASSIINRMVELSLGGIRIAKGDLTKAQHSVFEAFRPSLEDFIEECAMEYLISGLVLPEVVYQRVPKKDLRELGVRNYNSLELPQQMWVRDPYNIEIKAPPIGGGKFYFEKLSPEMAEFIRTGGTYPDGTKDPEFYKALKKDYPQFVQAVKDGETTFKLDAPFVISRRVLSDSPYPTPYLSPAIEAMQHKRNMRRMDYSLAARVIAAILMFKVGNDNFPVVEGEEAVFDNLKNQIDSRGDNVERLFQLFVDHTVEAEWVVPPRDILMDANKYDNVNLDIIQALGFPKILITGEVARTGTTDADIAILAPIRSMEYLRNKLIRLVRKIVSEVAERNNIERVPEVEFNPINLVGFKEHFRGLSDLYASGNLSRTEYAKALGVDFKETVEELSEDNKILEKLGLPEYGPTAFSPPPERGRPEGSEDGDGE